MAISDILNQTAQARTFLSKWIRQTPTEFSSELSDLVGASTYIKLESLQVTGSFKLRGAFVRLAALSAEDRAKGAVTCSAGNHGWAVAFAGKELGVPVTVYLPSSVDPSKKAGIESLGAEVVVTEFPGYDDAEAFAKSEAAGLRRPFVSAFEDPEVMLGNGATLAAEVAEQVPNFRTLVTPVGGGGLAAGACLFLEAAGHPFRLVGAQHRQSPALQLSLERGVAQTRLPAVDTLAGGLEGGIGRGTFEIIRPFVDAVALLSEEEFFAAVVWMLAKPHYLIEPSAAAGIGAALSGALRGQPGPVVIVVTGRNLSEDRLRLILQGTPAGR